MLKIDNQNCYSGAEIVERLGPPFTLKRIEYLRGLGLVPRPIKIGTGQGTIGYYPEQVVNLLREIERNHCQGKSYSDLLSVVGDKVTVIEYKIHRLKKAYSTKRAIRQVETYRRLIVDKHHGTAIKPHDSSLLENRKQDCSAEISKRQVELKDLFAKKDNLRTDVLLKIKTSIEKLLEAESSKAALDSIHAEIKARGKG